MKPAEHHIIWPVLGILALSSACFSACAGNAPKAIATGPVPSANGTPGTDNSQAGSYNSGGAQTPPPYANSSFGPANSGGTANTSGTANTGNGAGTPTTAAVAAPASTPPGAQPPSLPPASPPAAAPAPVPANSPPPNCTTYYNLGYGDAYQAAGGGPWLTKSNADFTVPCVINAPVCTANNGEGLGTHFTIAGHGKLTFAKLTDANKGMEDVCIVARLTGT